MTIRLDPERLERELARRGWSAKDLADAAGCSPGTISAARHGRALTSATVAKIAGALREAPIVKGIDELLGAEKDVANGSPAAGVGVLGEVER